MHHASDFVHLAPSGCQQSGSFCLIETGTFLRMLLASAVVAGLFVRAVFFAHVLCYINSDRCIRSYRDPLQFRPCRRSRAFSSMLEVCMSIRSHRNRAGADACCNRHPCAPTNCSSTDAVFIGACRAFCLHVQCDSRSIFCLPRPSWSSSWQGCPGMHATAPTCFCMYNVCFVMNRSKGQFTACPPALLVGPLCN